jgi:hypothetical protein
MLTREFQSNRQFTEQMIAMLLEKKNQIDRISPNERSWYQKVGSVLLQGANSPLAVYVI